jgi:hypothetical protein
VPVAPCEQDSSWVNRDYPHLDAAATPSARSASDGTQASAAAVSARKCSAIPCHAGSHAVSRCRWFSPVRGTARAAHLPAGSSGSGRPGPPGFRVGRLACRRRESGRRCCRRGLRGLRWSSTHGARFLRSCRAHARQPFGSPTTKPGSVDLHPPPTGYPRVIGSSPVFMGKT